MDSLITLLLSNQLMFWILGIIVLVILIWLYNKNNDSKSVIDLADLVVDNETKRLSSSKLFRFGTWIVTTWGFIYLVSQGSLEEYYAIAYMGIWTGNALLRNYFGHKHDDQRKISSSHELDSSTYRHGE